MTYPRIVAVRTVSIPVYPCECGHLPHEGACPYTAADLLDADLVAGLEPTEPCVCPRYTADLANGPWMYAQYEREVNR